MFIPSADILDTSYFESRYIWNTEDEHVNGGSDFDDMTDTCSSDSYIHDEDVSIPVNILLCRALESIVKELGKCPWKRRYCH